MSIPIKNLHGEIKYIKLDLFTNEVIMDNKVVGDMNDLVNECDCCGDEDDKLPANYLEEMLKFIKLNKSD
jgi:hypothetical protein